MTKQHTEISQKLIRCDVLALANKHGGLTPLRLPSDLPSDPPWVRTLRKLASLEQLFDPAWADVPSGYNLLTYLHRLWMLDAFISLKWDKSRKLSLKLPHGYKNAYKPFGELYRWVATICELGIGLVNLDGVGATGWFAHIVAERAVEGFGIEAGKKGGKTDSLKVFKRQTKLIRSYENPFEKQLYPYTWKMIETMNRMGEMNSDYNRGTRSKFLQARSDLAKHLETPKWTSFQSDGEEWLIRLAGKGSSTKKIGAVNLSVLEALLYKG